MYHHNDYDDPIGMVHDKMNLALSGLIRGAGALLSPAGPRACLSILIYHQVLPEPDPMRPGEVDAVVFDWQMSVLSEHFNVLSLSEGIGRLRDGTLPARAVCITFDDGYRDNVTVALPMLRHHGLKATFFIASGFLDGRAMWNDAIIETIRQANGRTLDLTSTGLGVLPVADAHQRVRAASAIITALKHLPMDERTRCVEQVVALAGGVWPKDLMMRPGNVQELDRNGMDIGGHTINHPILARLSAEAARREISENKSALEAIIGRPITLFAYPNGRPGEDYAHEHTRMVREAGYRAAVSTAWGVGTSRRDPFQLPRFLPWDRTPGRFALRLLENYRRRAPAQV